MKNNKNFNPLGLLALLNVELADRSYTTARNDFKSFLEMNFVGIDEPPIASQSLPLIPGTTLVAPYGAATVNDADQCLNLQFEIPVARLAGYSRTISVLGYLVTQRYQNFTQGKSHSMNITGFSSNYVQAPSFSRAITVIPTGGSNSTTEFIILNMVPARHLSYLDPAVVSGQTVPVINDLIDTPKGWLMPWKIRTTSTDTSTPGLSSILIQFKGLLLGSDVSTSVTPLFRTPDSMKQLAAILQLPYTL